MDMEILFIFDITMFLVVCLFVIVLLCVGLYFYTQAICNSPDQPVVHEYASNVAGKTVLLIAGTHGNEPAGSVALYKLKKQLDNKEIKIKQGKLLLIPEVNPCGLYWGTRSIFFVGDINRQYYNNSCSNINTKVAKLAQTADFVVDFHEGWGYHVQNQRSIGSTVSHTNTMLSKDIATQAVDNINKTISDAGKKYTLLGNDREQINGTLSMLLKDHSYILVETTGQNNVQHLDIRVNQNMIVIQSVLLGLGLM